MSNPLSFSIRSDVQTSDAIVNGNLQVQGDLTVQGAINPGTFTNRVVALTAPTAGPAGPANVTVLTASQSGTTFVLPNAATNDWHIVLPPYALGLKFRFVRSGAALVNDIDIFPGTYVVGATAGASGLPTAATQGTILVYVQDVATDACTQLVSAIGGGLGTVTGGIMFSAVGAPGPSIGPDTLELECVLATQGATSAAGSTCNWLGTAYAAAVAGIIVSA